jgi:acetyl-CoA carboxylase carboxyl transferase subunit alpha
MLQYSTYSVISPEGCASILWKSAEKAPEAAEALGITSERLQELGLIDAIIAEPLGGAHRDHDDMAERVRLQLREVLAELTRRPLDELLHARGERLRAYGTFPGA